MSDEKRLSQMIQAASGRLLLVQEGGKPAHLQIEV